ncbi:MAG: hypothetical protein LBO04_07905, partial [Spirochaetaceae bacterium]|nr:hypothetical protein [Spirochaetaceae bacterium]
PLRIKTGSHICRRLPNGLFAKSGLIARRTLGSRLPRGGSLTGLWNSGFKAYYTSFRARQSVRRKRIKLFSSYRLVMPIIK